MRKPQQMKVIIRGPEPIPPEKITIPRGANLVKEITKILDTFEADNMVGTVLISTQTGSGKTYGMLHGVLPWARERNLQTLYVSSRVAINTQFKDELVEETGQGHLKDELTKMGMRNRSEFDGIDVITYHKLLFNLQYDKASMKCYDVLIFDEIHALLDDSMFVGGTGQLLKKLEDFCALVGKRDDIWYATSIELFDYLRAAKNLRYSANCEMVYNPSATSVWIEVNDEKIIEAKGGCYTRLT